MKAQEQARRLRRLRLLLRAYYLLPLLVWLTLIVLGATGAGGYMTTWNLIVFVLNLMAPNTPTLTAPPAQEVSLYKLNEALRGILHIVGFGVLTALAIRALQGGETRLKRTSVATALGLAVLFVATNAVIMSRTADRHTGLGDWLLDGIGIVLVLGGSLFVYALRDWAARTRETLLNDSPPPTVFVDDT